MNQAACSCSAILTLFASLFSSRVIARWKAGFKKSRRGTYERIFSLRVTLWYLIYQRLHEDCTLSAVLKNLRAGGADRLGPRRGGKLSKKARSHRTSAYDKARQRLPLELIEFALAQVGHALRKMAGVAVAPDQAPPPSLRDRRLFDGSTMAALRTPDLAKHFPPGRNQRGASDWCLMRIVVGFCAKTGGVLGAVCGPVQQSEQAMAWGLMAQASAFTIWIGDRNFGVWSVIAQAKHLHQDVLVRLTRARYNKLCAGQPLASGQERAISWKRSGHDQAPPDIEDTCVSGRLIYVQLIRAGYRPIDLWLFTTLPADQYPIELLVQWYGQRWQAELNFRYVKTQMKMAVLQVRSAAMARKEFYAGLLAYSLIRGVMWAAGERLEQKGHAISFSEARRVLALRLNQWGRREFGRGLSDAAWMRSLLGEVELHRLPGRRKKRPNEPRRVRYRNRTFLPLRGSRAAARVRDAEPL